MRGVLSFALHLAAVLAICAATGAAAVFLALWGARTGLRPAYQEPPEPDGLVLRIELPKAVTPWGNESVRVLGRNPARLLVTHRDPVSDQYFAVEYAYPSGEAVGEPQLAAGCDEIARDARFDFDGDGVEDQLECEWSYPGHAVRVRSGATGEGLFGHFDPREYEYETGAFPLGDLDGDGCAELALVHPRKARSDYDLGLYDRVFGVHSWITVVSGARACAP